MSTRTVFIEGPERLEGVLHEGAGRGVSVICHPHPLYGGSMWNEVVEAMEEGFLKAGFSTLRFNFRGVGGSSGRYDEGKGETDDLLAACQFLKERANEGARFAIAGYSFGAWISSMAALRVAGVTDLFLVAFPFSSYSAAEIRSFPGRVLLVGGSFDDISPEGDLRAFYRDLKGEKLLKVIPTSHFFEGLTAEISEFVVECFRKEEG